MSVPAVQRQSRWSTPPSAPMSTPSLLSLSLLPMALRCLIVSYLPFQDKLTIIRRLNGDFSYVSRHPPSWSSLSVIINGRTLSAPLHGAADCFKHARAVTVGACDMFAQAEWMTLTVNHASSLSSCDGARSFLAHFTPNVTALTVHCQTALKRQSAHAITAAFDSLTRLHTLTLTGDITTHIVTALAHSSLTHLDLRTAIWHTLPPTPQQQQQQIPQQLLHFITGAQQQNAMAALMQQQNAVAHNVFNIAPPVPMQRTQHAQQQTNNRQSDADMTSPSRAAALLTLPTLITQFGARLRTLHLPIITLSDGAPATAADMNVSNEILAAIADTHSLPTSRLHTLTVAQNTTSLGLAHLQRAHGLTVLDLSHCLYVNPDDVLKLISNQLLLKCLSLPHFLARNKILNNINNTNNNNNGLPPQYSHIIMNRSLLSSSSASTSMALTPLTINQSLVDAIGQLVHLEQLLTHPYSEFDDDISTHPLTALKRLTVLRLRGGTLYSHIAPLLSHPSYKHITVIDFTQSSIADDSVEQMCAVMPRLVSVTLDHCQEITVKSIFTLSHLTELSALSIDQCPSMTITKVAMTHHKKIDDNYLMMINWNNNNNNNSSNQRRFPRLTYLSCRINDATLWDFPGFNQLLHLLPENNMSFINIEPLYEPQPLLYLHTMMQRFPYIRWLVSAEKLCNTSECRIIKKDLIEQFNRVEMISSNSSSLLSSTSLNISADYHSQTSLLHNPFLPHWNEDENDMIQRVEREDDDDRHKALLYHHDQTHAKPIMTSVTSLPTMSLSSQSSTTTTSIFDSSHSACDLMCADGRYMQHTIPLRLSWCDILPSALAQHSSALYTFRSDTHRARFMDLIAKRLQSITDDEQRREALMDEDGNVPPQSSTDTAASKALSFTSSTVNSSSFSSARHSPSSLSSSRSPSPNRRNISLMRNDLFDGFADDFEVKANDDDEYHLQQMYAPRYPLPANAPTYATTSSSSSSSSTSYNEGMGTSDLYGHRIPPAANAQRNDRSISYLRRLETNRSLAHDLRDRRRAVRTALRRQTNMNANQLRSTTSLALAMNASPTTFVASDDEDAFSATRRRSNLVETTTNSARHSHRRRRSRPAALPTHDLSLSASAALDEHSLSTHNNSAFAMASWMTEDDNAVEKKSRCAYDLDASDRPLTMTSESNSQQTNSFDPELDDDNNGDDEDDNDDDVDDEDDDEDILDEEDIHRLLHYRYGTR